MAYFPGYLSTSSSKCLRIHDESPFGEKLLRFFNGRLAIEIFSLLSTGSVAQCGMTVKGQK
jgi:hypothetical protein